MHENCTFSSPKYLQVMCWTLHIFDEIKLFLTSILKKMNSESKTLRQKGNEILLSIKDHTPNCIKELRLNEANRFYLDAFNKSNNDLEKSSAAKNISTACFKLLK